MATAKHVWGAMSYDWFVLTDWLGLGADLLPVVCKPDAEVSPNSNLKDYRKTPSMYNSDGKVVGIHQWTRREVTTKDIEKWSMDPDYGICIRCKQVKAIDIDVEDETVAEMVRKELMKGLGITYAPYRWREGTGKCLVPVKCDGLVLKDSFDCGNGKGIVELLGDRQQFVAVGTHKSGKPYLWNGSMTDMPEVSREQLDDAWRRLKLLFAVDGKSRRSNVTERSVGEHVAMEDALADYIVDNGLVVAERRDGGYDVACPWVHEHSDGGADGGLAAFWPAGKNGILRSGFCCLHAHCAGRNSNDYAKAIGFDEAQFDIVEPEPDEPAMLPVLRRDQKGVALATLPNLVAALERPDITGFKLAHDTFLESAIAVPEWGCGHVRVDDKFMIDMRHKLERGVSQVEFKPIAKDLMRDAIQKVSYDNVFDSAINWANAPERVWDGVPRVDTMMTKYFGVPDTPYARAVGRYVMSALAGRVLQPGVKADMVPILVGKQGIGKSTGVAALAPDGLFGEVDMSMSDDNLIRATLGKVVIELAELTGLSKRETESVKAYISKQVDEWVPKYQESTRRHARRFILFGTSNTDEILRDDTGNRRFLPVTVETRVDVSGIEEDRDQLWAEGIALFKRSGVLFREAMELARAEHGKYMIHDAWEEQILDWLINNAVGRDFVSTDEIASNALFLSTNKKDRGATGRIASVMSQLGWTSARGRVKKKQCRGWKKPENWDAVTLA